MNTFLGYEIHQGVYGDIYINVPYGLDIYHKSVRLYLDFGNYDVYILEANDYEDHTNIGVFKTQEAALECFKEVINIPNYCIYDNNAIVGYNFEDKKYIKGEK